MSNFKPDPSFRLETPRLIISHIFADNPMHCQFIVDLYNTHLFLEGEGKTGIDTPELAQRFINGRIKGLFDKFGYGHYLISSKQDETKPLGTVSLTQGDSVKSFPGPDIGFALLPEATGMGYATEAAVALIEYAKETLGVALIFGFCAPSNTKSRAALERVGMEDRGVMKLKMFGNQPTAVYALRGLKELSEYGVGEDQISSE